MESENLGIKTIEKILATEISDWVRWGRSKNYLPVSFRCPLGFLYVPKRGDLQAKLYKPAPINLLAVVEFERLVIGLPTRHRQAFVMYHLNRALIGEKIVEKKRNTYDMARLLGVRKRQFHDIVLQAHNMIFRNWKLKNEVQN